MMVLIAVTTILTSNDYCNTCFSVLVRLVCKSVVVLVIVKCLIMRLPTAGTDLGFADLIAYGVVTVDVAAFLLVVVLLCASQTASGTLVNINVVPNSRVIGVDGAGYLIVAAIAFAGTC